MTNPLNVHDTWINVECNSAHYCKNIFYIYRLSIYSKDVSKQYIYSQMFLIKLVYIHNICIYMTVIHISDFMTIWLNCNYYYTINRMLKKISWANICSILSLYLQMFIYRTILKTWSTGEKLIRSFWIFSTVSDSSLKLIQLFKVPISYNLSYSSRSWSLTDMNCRIEVIHFVT